MLDHALWELNPIGYHLTNITIHALNTITLFYLVFILFPEKALISVTASLVFAVHPIHTEAVNAISYREDLLATLFYLISLVSFIKTLKSPKWLYSAITLIAYALALLSKEMALTLPLMAFLTHLSFEKKAKFVLQRKWIYLNFAAVFGLYFLFLFFSEHPLRHTIPTRPDLAKYPINLPTMLGILYEYLRLTALPINLNPHHNFTRYASLFDPRVIATLLVVMTVILAGIYLTRRKGILGLFILWFFVALLPVSGIIAISNPIAERFLYLPSIGPIVVFSLLMNYIRQSRRVYYIVLLILVLTFGSLLTSDRNTVWKDDYRLWKDSVKKEPRNPVALSSLAMAAFRMGKVDEAMLILDKAASLNPKSAILAMIYHERGLIYEAEGNDERAVESYKAALGLSPYNYNIYMSIGFILKRQGRFLEAIDLFMKVLDIQPGRADIHFEMGLIYERLNDYTKAIEEYTIAKEAMPVETGINLGIIYGKEGDYSKAVSEFKEVLKIAPNDIKAHLNLGIAYMYIGENLYAKEEFKKVIELDPRNSAAAGYLNILRQR